MCECAAKCIIPDEKSIEMAETKETKKETKKVTEKETKKETKKEETAKVKTEEVAAETKEEVKEEEKQLSSTENNRRKKAERREAKAARKAANMVEEKKRRPNNALIALLIFGVVFGMFAFIGGYNYYQKAESIEKYMEDNGMAESYKHFQMDEYTTASVKAEGNTIKMVLKIAEDAPEEAVKTYQEEPGKEELKNMGAYLLTSMKPETRGFTGEVRMLVKQGDKKINYVKMSYREAKKFVKDAEKKAEKEAEESGSEE